MIKIGCDEIYIEKDCAGGINIVSSINKPAHEYSISNEELDCLFYMLHEERKSRMMKVNKNG